MSERAVSYSVQELAGMEGAPEAFSSARNLVYSSPATLAFNSPGAEGFGVKRAALAVPGSVMLIVSPGCCGRNTSAISSLPGYENRFFYLTMSETDLVTARHLRRIPDAVQELVEALDERPSVVMVCITCVDALLGTDMDRVCKKASARVGIPVVTVHMFALTREGRKPPMVHVRQTIYSLLQKRRRRASSVNLLGYFAPLDERSELPALLRSAGVRQVRQIAACADYAAFQEMAEANFNVVLTPEAGPAAADLQERLGLPWIELTRFYEVDRIGHQYDALGQAIGAQLDYASYRDEARSAMRSFREKYPDTVFAVGEACDADPFELALALVRYGFTVAEIFGTVRSDSGKYLRDLAQLSPETRVYSNLHPTMIDYDPALHPVTVTIGRDAGYYHPEVPNLSWNQDLQPWGFGAVTGLFTALSRVLGGEAQGIGAISLRDENAQVEELSVRQVKIPAGRPQEKKIRGFQRVLTPFAPDQSGAVSVLFSFGGISAVVDAGGCVGNICGFDEPRWFAGKSAIFSAALRDMDAILGRDDLLVKKLVDAAGELKRPFAAIIGTPVPSVIGTDYAALARMAQKKAGLPVLCVDTDGMEYYDRGIEKAYLALLQTFVTDKRAPRPEPGRLVVFGATPMDLGKHEDGSSLRRMLSPLGWNRISLYGMDADLEELRSTAAAQESLVLSVGGLAAARWLWKKYRVPYQPENPLARKQFEALVEGMDLAGEQALVIGEQVSCSTIARELLRRGAGGVTCAGWFMHDPDIAWPSEVQLRTEEDLRELVREGDFTLIVGDPALLPLCDGFEGTFVPMRHFALSGK